MEPSLTHAALRTRIAKVRSAAHDGDLKRLHWEFERLKAAIADHLAVESSEVAALSEPARRDLRQGQARVEATLATLTCDIEQRGEGLPREAVMDRLDALLELQDEAERRALRHRINRAPEVSHR
jgi:hypothetical protein